MRTLTTSKSNSINHRRKGFSLMEVVLAVSIMSVIAGATLPVTFTVLNQAHSKATKEELRNLAEASSRMFEDTKTLPILVEGLLIDQGVAGWSGPYLPGSFSDGISGLGGYEVDSWSNAYSLSISGNALTITSMGSDGIHGTEDDLVLSMDATLILRSKTLDNLAIINSALQSYNALNLVEAPLPANFGSVRSALCSKGFLPESVRYQVDAWGDAYVEDPRGQTPVVRVKSVNVAAN